MNKKLYWGLGILFGLIIGGFVFLLIQQKAELNQWEADAAKDKKLATAETPPIVENNQPTARPGYKQVKHGDHFHEVPIDAPDTWQEEPVAQDKPVVQTPVTTYTGPLTFHDELLKTNPVKALRLLAEEIGHPAAKWIPPFPPDDQEAQEFARNIYLCIYLDEDDPAYEKAARAETEQMRAIDEKYPYGARLMDLSKLIWVLGSRTLSHYNQGGTAKSPSDYFPLHISDLK